jgi:hypothetical protein
LVSYFWAALPRSQFAGGRPGLGAEGGPLSRLALQNLEKTVVFFRFYLS